MKKSSMTLLSLLTLSGAVFANQFDISGPLEQGVYQFSQGDTLKDFKLCTYEVFQRDTDGVHKTMPSSTGSVNGIVSLASATDDENYLVFYPTGKEGVVSERRILRKRFLVELKPGADLPGFQARYNIQNVRRFREGSNFIICEEESAAKVLSQLQLVGEDAAVKTVDPLFARTLKKHLVPNDTFYPPFGIDFNNPYGLSVESYQWYLNNQGLNGSIPNIDINVEDAWDQATGAGVIIGVVDDGVSVSDAPEVVGHEELNDRVAGELVDDPDNPGEMIFVPWHRNWQDGEPDSPVGQSFEDTHGTGVAGLIVGEFNNEVGIAGVAPGATFASLRLTGLNQVVDDLDIAEALTYELDVFDIYNNSWGPNNGSPTLEQFSPLVMEALQLGVETGRPSADGPLGAIYVFSAGDDAVSQDNANYNSLGSSPYTISVGAIADNGKKAVYSEEGANLVVSAPSSGGSQDVLTTFFQVGTDDDGFAFREPIYTDTFTGTSASAPLVSGVVALMLEANPDLGWRDVQEILMDTAVKIDPNSGRWYTNAAGREFNHSFGAGMVNATDAVTAAAARGADDLLAPVETQVWQEDFTGSVEIPEGTGESYNKVFNFADGRYPNMRVEHVEVEVTILTLRRADVKIVLVSPSGTQSVLALPQDDNTEQSISNYSFMSVRNWGEGSEGEWVLRVTDTLNNDIPAEFNNAQLTIHGVPDSEAPIGDGPVLLSDRVLNASVGDEINYLIETRNTDTITVGVLPPGLDYEDATQLIFGVASQPGIFTIPITLEGPGGISESSVSMVVRPTESALGSAVEQDLRPTIAGGDAPFDFEFNTTLDGIDGVGSAVGLGDDEESTFGFDSVDEGVVIFDWSVSSQTFDPTDVDENGDPFEANDRLWFNFGGQVPHDWSAFIDGERPYGSLVLPRGTVAVTIPDNSNNLRWIYAKDSEVSRGQDRGFVDQVRFMDLKTYMDDVQVAGNLNFPVEFNGKTMWIPFDFPLGSPDEPGGARQLLRTSGVGNGQTVSMSSWLEGPGLLSYRVSVSSEETDVFEMALDGVARVSIGGTQPIITQEYEIPEGLHLVEFRYRKDFTVDLNNDVAFLDDINFLPTSSAARWEAGFGLALLPDEDFDKDGYDNRLEYAFGGNPTVADIPSNLPRFVKSEDGSYIEYGLDQSVSDYDLVAEESSDLENWTEAANATKNRTVGSVDFYRIQIDQSASDEQLYFRVVAKPKS